ncbi:hypothetical protein BDZ91DRAFT_709556 [Kalaharituber pfeilii]|nr:hypothetical protein BDZ91DRAFT_709556 [Kalaharituber pfeilii]
MPERPNTGKIVFVGNIPYGLTEEQISEIFSSVGRVVSFRLVYDRETGRPKGFGFAEYQDPETAASAVRNLDGHEVMGRKLRVDFSHEGNAPDIDSGEVFGPGAMGGINGSTSQPGSTGAPQPSSSLPPLPPGVEVPPNLQAPEMISQTLKALPPTQLLDIVTQMKQLATADPVKAAELLRQAPQLSYAIFQALLLMNLVDTSVLTKVIDATATQAAAAAPPVTAAPPQAQTAAYGYPQPTAPQPPPQQVYQPPPPPPQQHIPPPQAQPQPQVQQVATDQRAELIRQVMQLTPEQLSALPPDQQQQIMILKHQLMASGATY